MQPAELKTLMALTGPVRLPTFEIEIFANTTLTSLYLNNLYSGHPNYELDQDEVPTGYIYHYARFTLKGRWPEAEALLLTSAWYAYHYAVDIIKGPWPEGEAIIKTSKFYSEAYYARFNILL